MLSLAEQSQVAALLRANNSRSEGPSGIRSGGEELPKVFIAGKADKKDGNIDKVIKTTEANGCGLQETFCELQTECLAVHTQLFAGLVDVMQTANRSIAL